MNAVWGKLYGTVVILMMPAFAGDALCGSKSPHVSMRDDELPVVKNMEREAPGDGSYIPFSISVDGETVGRSEVAAVKGSRLSASDTGQEDVKSIGLQHRANVGLHGVNIQIKYDEFEVKPVLNVSTTTMRSRFRAGEEIRFLATSNYPAFIKRAEIRIEEMPAGSGAAIKPQAVIPVAINREAGWIMPAVKRGAGAVLFDDQAPAQFAYVLRVYDAQGRYDETEPLILTRRRAGADGSRLRDVVAPGEGEDRAALRNIAVRGGAITVFGRNVPRGYHVEVLGERISLDRNQAFVVQRLLPPGEHNIDVSVNGVSKSGGLQFSRSINLPDDEWFYVALADLTVGKRLGKENIEAVRPGEYDKAYTKGRLAFYLKGKIKGEYLLTAAVDTGEDDLENLFRDLDGKGPRHLLRRLDPDDYYPIYGDDSSFVEDAPTKGRFYVRLDRGDNRVMWGNYKTRITGTEFMRAERGLYGANAVYRSEAATSFGDRRTEATFYAAQPDTLPQREEFLATGGSGYFLRRQDIVEGSETVTVEIRDRVTGHVIERTRLQYGRDYHIDYIQGVIILQRPLSSVVGTGGPVRNGALGSNKVYLTVQYEFEPTVRNIDDYAYGGRAQHWLNDHVRVGVTGMNEDTGEADQRAVGADILLRHSEETFLEAEVAHSEGPGFGLLKSVDGGLTQGENKTVGLRGRPASAWRLKGQVGLEDIADAGLKGTVGGYYEGKQAGFSTLYDQVSVDKRIWGVHADVALNESTDLRLIYDDFHDGAGQIKREGTSGVSWQMDDYWRVSFGVSYTELMSPMAFASNMRDYDGSRLDAGMRVDYRWDDDRLLYGFGQATLDRSGDIARNDRLGIGTEIGLTETIGVTGEISYGTHGFGGLAAVNYDPNDDERYYIGYKLDPDRAFDADRTYGLTGSDKGTLVAGLRRRMDDVASTYAESSYDMFGKRKSLTQTYGVVYTPDDMWTLDAGLEVGRVRDDTLDEDDPPRERSDFDRYAPSLSVAYKDEETGTTARARGEVRIEDSEDGTRDQNTYLFAAGLSWQTSDDWRLITNIDAVISDTRSTVTSYQNIDYVETSLGYAYRPANNDRLNALFKYTWLYDLPGNSQLASGATNHAYAPAQRSHILSADVTYDLFPWLSIGGKYGFRYGEVKYRTLDLGSNGFVDEWQRSSAHLGVLRTDLHVVKNWDFLLEGRVLRMSEADTTQYGTLVAIYRHVGNNFKIGIGYNFGRFSDDLRDLTLDDQGVFLNIVGKF